MGINSRGAGRTKGVGIVDKVILELIESNPPGFPDAVRSVGSAISVVRQLIERESLVPRVVAGIADPDSVLTFTDVRMVTVSGGDGVKASRSLEPIYTEAEALHRLQLLMGISGLAATGNLSPFGSVAELATTVMDLRQHRISKAMHRVCDTAEKYIGSLATRSDKSEILVAELADAVAVHIFLQNGTRPKWTKKCS